MEEVTGSSPVEPTKQLFMEVAMPETISPGKDEQEAVESKGALTAEELLAADRREKNEGRSEMSIDKDELLAQKVRLEQQLADAENARDNVTAESVRFDLASIEAQLDVISRQEEHKND